MLWRRSNPRKLAQIVDSPGKRVEYALGGVAFARKPHQFKLRISPEGLRNWGAEVRPLTLSLKAITPRPLERNRFSYF
jgi:hypothetical protein